jgi:hypothetical protein
LPNRVRLKPRFVNHLQPFVTVPNRSSWPNMGIHVPRADSAAGSRHFCWSSVALGPLLFIRWLPVSGRLLSYWPHCSLADNLNWPQRNPGEAARQALRGGAACRVQTGRPADRHRIAVRILAAAKLAGAGLPQQSGRYSRALTLLLARRAAALAPGNRAPRFAYQFPRRRLDPVAARSPGRPHSD